MEPVTIILLIAVVVGYFALYRPFFIVRPAKKKLELIAKFEQAAALNRQLIAGLRQFADQHHLLDQPFMDQATFGKKITELEAARDEALSEENLLLVRSRNPQHFDIQLFLHSLDDQLTYHNRISKAFEQYKAANGLG